MKLQESGIIAEITKKAKTLFENTRFTEVLSIQGAGEQEFGNRTTGLEMVLKIKNGKKYRLIFEIKSVGQPRYVRSAVNQLQTFLRKDKNSYGLVCAPYLSEESINICRENNVGCMDLAGNCFVEFENIFIQVNGNPNPYVTTRQQKSLFAVKSTRILRALLCNPKKTWQLSQLAKEAAVSLGQASNVKQKLLDYEFIVEDDFKKMVLKNMDSLLKKWAESYSYRQNKIYNFYSLDTPQVTEGRISEYCSFRNIPYAFTLTTGSDLIYPYLRYQRVFLYLNSKSIDDLSRDLQWKSVKTGPSITVLEPYDEGVFYGIQDIGGKKVVSDIQLYLDLQSYKERGTEAAGQILEKRIKIKW